MSRPLQCSAPIQLCGPLLLQLKSLSRTRIYLTFSFFLCFFTPFPFSLYLGSTLILLLNVLKIKLRCGAIVASTHAASNLYYIYNWVLYIRTWNPIAGSESVAILSRQSGSYYITLAVTVQIKSLILISDCITWFIWIQVWKGTICYIYEIVYTCMGMPLYLISFYPQS